MEIEVFLAGHLSALSQYFHEVIIGGPFILIQKEVIRAGITVRRIGEILKKVVTMPESELHIRDNDIDGAVADAIHAGHGIYLVQDIK